MTGAALRGGVLSSAIPTFVGPMKRPEEIATDVRRELIREAARSISHRGGRLSAGRIARDARLPKPTVVALLPTFGEEELRDLADAVDGEQAEKPERELAAVA